MTIFSTTFAIPVDGINTNDGDRETTYKSAKALENVVITPRDVSCRGGFVLDIKPSYLRRDEVILHVINLGTEQFILTNKRVASFSYFTKKGDYKTADINYIDGGKTTRDNIKIIDFTNANGDSGCIILNYNNSNPNDKKYKMFTVFLDNGGNVIVSDITKDLNTFDVNPVPDVSSQYAYIITPRYITETVNGVNFPQFAGGSTLNGILSTPPYSISPSLDAKRVWYTGNAGSKPAVPTGGVVNPVDGSIVVAPDLWSLTPQPSIQAGQLRYYSVLISSIGATNKWSDVYTDCVIDRNKLDYPDDNQRQAYYIKASITNNIITWGSPTAWFNGVYYADNIAVHDGRIVLVDKDNNFLYFGISKNTFKYFGIDSSSTMIEYPVGSFVNTSSTIAEVVSSTLSGITSQLSLNFFVLMVSGELLSFTGNYPSIDSSIWGAGGVVQIPSSLSNTQSFVRAQADIHYVSSQGIISLFNSIRAGQYEVLNDKLQTRFNSIARSGANVKVSSVFAWRQNVILHQVDDTTYVYNLISKSWSTWKISNYGYFYYYSGNLYCLSLNGLTLSKYNTSTFLDDAYYLPNQSTDGGFNGVVFGIKNTIPGIPIGGVLNGTTLSVPPTSDINPPTGGWTSTEPLSIAEPSFIWVSRLTDRANLTWSTPEKFFSKQPINGSIVISYNPVNDDNNSIKNIRSITLWCYGFNYRITPTINADWGKNRYQLPSSQSTTAFNGYNWDSSDWTDGSGPPTAQTLRWSNNEQRADELNAKRVPVGIPMRSFSLQIDFSTSGGFSLHDYDVSSEVVSQVLG